MYKSNLILLLLIGAALSMFNMTRPITLETSDIQNIINIDGNCYLKYPIKNQQEVEHLQLPIYTGSLDQLDESFIDRRLIEITPEKRGWVKVEQPEKKDLVWCLADEPGEYLELLVVRDTNQIKTFEYHTAQLSKKEADGVFYQLEQIVCKEDQNEDLFDQVCQALMENGYTKKCKKKGLNDKLKKKIAKYQKDHKLPVGQFNYKTLEHLGVKLN